MPELAELLAGLSPQQRELLALLQKEKAAPSAAPARESGAPLTPRTSAEPALASLAQQRLWVLAQMQAGSDAYHIPFVRRLRGQLDVAALARALQTIVARHTSLRTRFALAGEQLRGEVAPVTEFQLGFRELSDLPAVERWAAAQAQAQAAVRRPFDLASALPLRVELLKLAEDDHLVVLVLHHLVADGWSLGVLLRELAVLYRAFKHGAEAALPDLPVQYADFAAWQREALQGAALEELLTYWRTQLHGAPPLLELPTDRPRAAAPELAGATCARQLTPELAAQLKALSQQTGVTLFMTTLAAFNVLLYRYSGQTDLVVGTPVANRDHAETEGLIGLFVNTLALRTTLRGDWTFRQLLEQVRATALGAFTHQQLPFERLVQALATGRERSYTPLFQVMFTLQNVPLTKLELDGLTLELCASGPRDAMFDLTLTLIERPEDGQLRAELEYSTALFDAATAERLLQHYVTLLNAIVAQPAARLDELPLLSAAERAQVFAFGKPASSSTAPTTFAELFAQRVAQTPAACALSVSQGISSGEAANLSFAELNARANQLAHALRGRGVGPETRVGVALPPGAALPVALLAVLKAGGAYVPLELEYPAERLAFIARDAELALVLTHAAQRERCAACEVPLLCLDEEAAALAAQPTEQPTADSARAASGANAAYVLYTSGSTGAPKGVLISQAALAQHAQAAAARYELRPGDRVLQFAASSFDVAAEELFPTWLAGATVVLHAHVRRTPLSQFAAFVEAEQLSVLNLPAAFFHEWVNALASAETPLPAALRLLIVGSDRVAAERFARWQQFITASGERVPILNAYGPTEATITATVYEPPPQFVGTQVPLGRPLGEAQVFVLDERLQAVPAGVPGEIYLGGPGLARGYVRQPGLTAERFVPHPFSAAPGARLYRTGDRARWLADGNLDLLGRVDQQVKLRGFRIELGEIETALAQQPGVQAAAVKLWAEGVGGQPQLSPQLVAYVVAEAASPAATSELREALKQRLPGYMIPAQFVWLAELPRLANGKPDRQALPAPVASTPERAATVAPQTALEELIAEVWRDALKLETVSVTDNFFDLGGHSLLMSEVFAKLQARLERPLTLVELFEYPTIRALADFLDSGARARAARQQGQEQAERAKEGKNRLRQQFRQRQQAARRK